MQHSTRSAEPKAVRDAQATSDASTPKAPKPRFGPDLQAQIGDQLRAMHHDVLNEKVPDRFVQLLKELASKRTTNTHE
jgi:hypothetical protein